MLATIGNVINMVVEFMKTTILPIDGYNFSLWEILMVSTAGVIIGKTIGSILNIYD